LGAGVLPFTVSDGKVDFLFQTTFTGRKAGYLNDFGGGLGAGEDYHHTAIREFIEETETMYFSDNPAQASRTEESVRSQIPLVEALFQETLSAYPDWWCPRAPGDPLNPKDWRTFFVEFPRRDIGILNREWASDTGRRFRKRRELVWVTGSELLAIYEEAPDKLWKRVRQLENATATIQSILLNKASP
jgi:hypothetical protein